MSSRLVVAAALVGNDRILAMRRTYPAALAGKWEFPGGKVESGESPQTALHRELAEELGIAAQLGPEIPPDDGAVWPISASLGLRLWWARVTAGTVCARESHDRLGWFDLAELARLDWLPADLPIVRKIQRIGLQRIGLALEGGPAAYAQAQESGSGRG